jgi:hypothetical protein
MPGINAKICHICGANNARQLIGLDANNREIYECVRHRQKRAAEETREPRGSGGMLKMFAEGAKKAMGEKYYIKLKPKPGVIAELIVNTRLSPESEGQDADQ